MTFEADVADLGFELVGQRRGGAMQYSRRTNPFLHWWLLVDAAGAAQLAWEFELGSYLKSKGFTVSAQDELSLLLFPSHEVVGPADGDWLREQIERSEQELAGLDLLHGT